jgi:hypothetical protein
VERCAKEFQHLIDQLVDAESDDRRRDLLPEAVDLHCEVFEVLSFLMSASSKSEFERVLMFRLIDYDAREAFAPIWRAMQIVTGNERGIDPDMVRLSDAD